MAANLGPRTRTHEILHAHFPELRTLLLDALEGRKSQDLRQLIEPQRFMAEWSIKVRYGSSEYVMAKPQAEWAASAKRAISLMEAAG
jgi:hypothetical protein